MKIHNAYKFRNIFYTVNMLNNTFARLFVIPFLCIIFSVETLSAQNSETEYFRKITEKDTLYSGFSFRNISFIKNIEAFDQFQKGYTMPGTRLEAGFSFPIVENLSVRTGGNVVKYFGDPDSTLLIPLLRIKWEIASRSSVIIGSLPDALNLSLPDFMIRHEPFLTKPRNEGLAFMYNGNKLQACAWFESEQYIHRGSLYPEHLFGASNWKWQFWERKNFQLYLNTGFSVGHHGGQIDSSNTRIMTIANAYIELQAEYKLNAKNKFLLSGGYGLANNASPGVKLLYNKGSSAFSEIVFTGPYGRYSLSGFYGNQWFTYKGNPIYSNISEVTRGYGRENRALIMPTAFKDFEIGKRANAGAGIYGLYELYAGSFSYGLSFFLSFDVNFTPASPILMLRE